MSTSFGKIKNSDARARNTPFGPWREALTCSLSHLGYIHEFRALCAGAVTLCDNTGCSSLPVGVNWDTIKDIRARYLHRRFDKPKLSKLERIAIDEIRLGTGSGYLTI
uniref:Uncharacterized protein n=1 Tax=Candidatus Kentrum sp. TC TaxID=2126339 RepID=A0A450ZQ40_9GAMM|nr:MAG: hypothetical protein BECKTC1821F_GA0114240_100850 [Candidatus Kentron sp. TC]